jgi:hypothetical protein
MGAKCLRSKSGGAPHFEQSASRRENMCPQMRSIVSAIGQTGIAARAGFCSRDVMRVRFPINLVHNHPSGDPTPSRADVEMTQAIVAVARPLGISVHDHIIVGKDGHASLKGMAVGSLEALFRCKHPNGAC